MFLGSCENHKQRKTKQKVQNNKFFFKKTGLF